MERQTRRRDHYRHGDKKIPYAIKLRPSTVDLLNAAAEKQQVSKNMIIETGSITEAQKLLEKLIN